MVGIVITFVSVGCGRVNRFSHATLILLLPEELLQWINIAGKLVHVEDITATCGIKYNYCFSECFKMTKL